MTDAPTIHVPVMAAEALEWLSPRPGQVIVDGTVGGGGHTRMIAELVGDDGLVIGLDRDVRSLQAVRTRLPSANVRLVHANFCDLPDVLQELEVPAVDGVLLDLGLSSDQLADDERGFSFDAAGPLDLRFDITAGRPAWQWIDQMRAEPLADLIYEFGEERFSRRIAREIVAARRHEPIRTAAQLAALVRRCVPRGRHERLDPATRTFQALRIAVNEELQSLTLALKRVPACLRPGGRLVAISFHSLEDRLVKHAFRADPRWTVLTKKPIRPSDLEESQNPRSRSAKLRAAARQEETKS